PVGLARASPYPLGGRTGAGRYLPGLRTAQRDDQSLDGRVRASVPGRTAADDDRTPDHDRLLPAPDAGIESALRIQGRVLRTFCAGQWNSARCRQRLARALKRTTAARAAHCGSILRRDGDAHWTRRAHRASSPQAPSRVGSRATTSVPDPSWERIVTWPPKSCARCRI